MNKNLLPAAALMALTITAAAAPGSHQQRAHRACEIIRARHALCAAAGRSLGASCGRLCEGHVLRRIHHRTCARFRRGKCRVFSPRPTRCARSSASRSSIATQKEVSVDAPGTARPAPPVSRRARDASPSRSVRTRSNFTPIAVKSRSARSFDPAMAHGRRAAAGAAAARDRRRETQGAVEAAFQPAGGIDRGVRGHLEGPAHRRALRRRASRRRRRSRAGRWEERHRDAVREFWSSEGVYDLDQPAPIPEWQTPGDPRAKIRIADILHMSSGLRIKAPQDPGLRPIRPVSGSPLPLHRRRRLLPLRGDAATAMAARTRSGVTTTPIRC